MRHHPAWSVAEAHAVRRDVDAERPSPWHHRCEVAHVFHAYRVVIAEWPCAVVVSRRHRESVRRALCGGGERLV